MSGKIETQFINPPSSTSSTPDSNKSEPISTALDAISNSATQPLLDLSARSIASTDSDKSPSSVSLSAHSDVSEEEDLPPIGQAPRAPTRTELVATARQNIEIVIKEVEPWFANLNKIENITAKAEELITKGKSVKPEKIKELTGQIEALKKQTRTPNITEEINLTMDSLKSLALLSDIQMDVKQISSVQFLDGLKNHLENDGAFNGPTMFQNPKATTASKVSQMQILTAKDTPVTRQDYQEMLLRQMKNIKESLGK